MIETDKQIAERVLVLGENPNGQDHCDDMLELARRLLARCEADEAKPKDELRGKAISDDEIMRVLKDSGVDGNQYDCLTFTRWKDGIDVDYPTAALRQMAERFAAMRSRAEGVPDGWKLVPLEMTDEMHNAAIVKSTMVASYRAAVDAAPSPGEKE